MFLELSFHVEEVSQTFSPRGHYVLNELLLLLFVPLDGPLVLRFGLLSALLAFLAYGLVVTNYL